MQIWYTVSLSAFFSLFFFFQAEDGIRDTSVTGVQTCALPISLLGEESLIVVSAVDRAVIQKTRDAAKTNKSRSEERRVGKECRSRWAMSESKKKSEVAGEWRELQKVR